MRYPPDGSRNPDLDPEDDADSARRRMGCAASLFLFFALNTVLWVGLYWIFA